MAFLRRWLLIGLVFLLGGGTGFAASREERAYRAAVLAFNDQFYATAQSQFTQFLQNYRKSTNAPMALLLLAQSEYHLKNYQPAINQLANPAYLALAKPVGLDDDYEYWRAEAQFAQGDLAGAAQRFMSVAQNYSDSPLALSAEVEAAEAFAILGQRGRVDDLLGNPNGFFQRTARLDPANRLVINGRLLQAESQCGQQNFAAAIQILNGLNPAVLSLDQNWKRARLLYRALLQQQNLAAALAVSTNLIQLAQLGHGNSWATNLAESVAGEAIVLEKLGRLEEASAVWQENFTNTVPAESQRQAVLKLADLAARLNQNQKAEARLEDYLAQFPNTPAVGVVLLALGELHLQDYVAQPDGSNDLAVAQAKLKQFLAATTSGPLAGKAHLDQGWCYWLAAQQAGAAGDTNAMRLNLTASLADFQTAINQLPPESEDLAVALFKAGDAQFALADYPGARGHYQAVVTTGPQWSESTNSLVCRALYQLLRADLAQTNITGMDETMHRLMAQYFLSAPADRGRLLAGQGFADFDQPAKAREVFLQFIRERTNSPLLPAAVFAAARTFAQEANWPEVITNCAAWLAAYPTNDLRPQVEYERAWAFSQAGDASRAFELFTNFINQFPTNATVTPQALWWVADHYFQQGDFVAAGVNYQILNEDFPAHELAYPARLMAARAAMGRFNETDAIGFLNRLISDTNCPAALQTQAQFAYCEALRSLKDTNGVQHLQDATNILAEICAKNSTNAAGALAWDEMGDYAALLGDYAAATNAYAQVQNLPAAAPELRYRAMVGMGDTLKQMAEAAAAEGDRKALQSQALNEYLAVVYSESNEWWVKQAAWRALALMDKVQTGNPEKFFNRLEALFPQLKAALEKKRADGQP